MVLPRWLQNVQLLMETFYSIYWLFNLYWPCVPLFYAVFAQSS
jgi:hypothetical protein